MNRSRKTAARPSRAFLAALAVSLLAAPPARAQLGIDLTAPPKKEERRRPSRKAPARKAPAPPPARETPPAAPPPAPAPAAAPAPPSPAPAAQERPRPSRSQPGLDLAPADPRSAAAAKERLEGAKRLLDEKAIATAAMAFDQILREPALSPAHDEARYQKAKALALLGLGYSSLAAFDAVLDRGPSGTRYYPTAMEWLFTVGKTLENEQPLLARVARHAGGALPPAQEDRVHFLLAKYEFERGRALLEAGRTGEARSAFGEARRLAAKVRPDGSAPGLPGVEAAKGIAAEPRDPDRSVHARAKLLDGLVLYAQEDEEGAIEAFKEVVRLTNPRRVEDPDEEARELAFLQLARVHYQNRQNRYAIFYYGKMPWGGERWLEGLWEASYAHYRVGDYEKTLGNLLTLQSPYFRDDYYPESYVLKAIVYYENCRYPEARRVLEELSSIYEPVYEELVRVTGGQRTADGWWELVRDSGAGAGRAESRKIMKAAFSDQTIRRIARSIEGMDREADVKLAGQRPEFRQSPLGKELVESLKSERAALVQELGARTRAKLEFERDQLRQLLAQALRIQIEVSRKEREALEGSLAKGSQVEVVRDLKYSHAVSDEHLYWPYEGEFWRDELGTYSYTLTKGCKDRLPRSSAAAR